MMTLLNKPFPFVYTAKQQLITAIGISMFVFVFLIIFQPFYIDRIEDNKLLTILGYAAITFSVILLFFNLFKLINPNYFDPDTWTVKKTILYILLNVLTISIANWYYCVLIDPEFSKIFDLGDFIFFTTTIGFLPIIFFILALERIFNYHHQSISNELSAELLQKDNYSEKMILLESNNSSEKLKIPAHQLICIKSEGNYINVYYLENKKISSYLLRNSLTNIAHHTEKIDGIYRCHRSYLVNFSFVEKINGNARNYTLQIKGLPFSIPVSRKFPKEIIQKITK